MVYLGPYGCAPARKQQPISEARHNAALLRRCGAAMRVQGLQKLHCLAMCRPPDRRRLTTAAVGGRRRRPPEADASGHRVAKISLIPARCGAEKASQCIALASRAAAAARGAPSMVAQLHGAVRRRPWLTQERSALPRWLSLRLTTWSARRLLHALLPPSVHFSERVTPLS